MFQLQLSNVQDPSIRVAYELPGDWNASTMSGSNIIRLTARDGTCTAQMITEESFSIRYIVTHFLEKVRLLIPPNDMVLQVWLAWRNDFIGSIKGLGKIHLREGEFVVIHAPKTAMEAALKERKEQQVVDVSYTLPVVEELYNTYPELREFMQAARKAKALVIGTSGLALSHRGKDVLMSLLRTDFMDREKEYFVRIKIREFFYISMQQVFARQNAQQAVSDEVAEQLQKLYEVLLNDTTRRYSLQEMSRITGLSIYAVAEAFKKRYGKPPKLFHIAVRLEKAHDLARDTTLPFKAIAAEVGYLTDTHLYNAFKKHFGYTPGSLRGEN